jgi:hypothetical protein
VFGVAHCRAGVVSRLVRDTPLAGGLRWLV